MSLLLNCPDVSAAPDAVGLRSEAYAPASSIPEGSPKESFGVVLMFINSEVRRQAFVVKRRGASKDAPATVGMPVAGRDERPRSSAWARGLAGVVGKWRMAEATHSGRGFWKVGHDRAWLEEAAHRGRFALPWWGARRLRLQP